MRLIIRCTVCGQGFEPAQGIEAFYPGKRYSLDLPAHDAPCGLPCGKHDGDAAYGRALPEATHGTSCPRCGVDPDDRGTGSR